MQISPILHTAVSNTLSFEEALLAAKSLTSSDLSPSQAGALLGALRARGEAASEIHGFVEALRAGGKSVPIDPAGLVDTCGTGGDGINTFNISTIASFVVAGAGGHVAKHGNRAVSSQTGSADVLEALGFRLNPAVEVIARSINETGFGFMMAPAFYPSLSAVAAIRRELGFRSIFNLVGPLLNPARVRRQVTGVPHRRSMRPVAEALVLAQCDHAWVVHGADGCDEMSLTGGTYVCEVTQGVIREFEVHPEDCGLSLTSLANLAGGTKERNSDIARAVLSGEPGPRCDAVALNAGAALLVADRVQSLCDGVGMAMESLGSGRAKAAFEAARDLSWEDA